MGQRLTALKFATILKILGGAVAVKCDKEFRKAILDCEDSPKIKEARKVALSVEFVPRVRSNSMNGETEYAGCDVKFKVYGRCPGQEVTVAMTGSEQGLLFNADAPDNPDQMTIHHGDDEEDEEDEEDK